MKAIERFKHTFIIILIYRFVKRKGSVPLTKIYRLSIYESALFLFKCGPDPFEVNLTVLKIIPFYA